MNLMKGRRPLDYIMFPPAYPPMMGGVERHVYEVHRCLKLRGLAGRVVVLHEAPPGRPREDDVRWLDLEKVKGWSRRSRFKLRRLRFAREVLFHARARLHFHDPMTVYHEIPWLARLGRLDRSYITFHGWEGIFPVPADAVRVRRECEEALAGNMIVGDFIAKYYGTSANEITYGGVDVERYRGIGGACADLPFRIAYLGRFEPDTGVTQLVRACQLFCVASRTSLELSLFGHGSLEPEIRQMQHDSALSIRVSDPVSDTAEVMRDFPIMFASGYLTILEALCAGRIVFAYYHNELRQDYLRMHPAAGSMFVCGNAEDVQNGLALCRASMARASELAAPGWEWAWRQSWENVALQYTRLWGIDR